MGTSIAGQGLALALAAVLPWIAVPLVAASTFALGWFLARPEPRSARRAWAIAVGSVDGVVVAGVWLALASADPEIAGLPWVGRAALAGTLGAGAALAGGSLVLVGADARAMAVDPG